MKNERKLILNIKKQILGIATIHIIEMIGVLDFESNQFFKEAIVELLGENAGDIILNGNKLVKLDEIGLGTLHFIQNQCWSFNGKLYLTLFSHLIDNFKELGIETFFQFQNSDEEALTLIKKEKGIEITEDEKKFPTIIICPNCGQKMKVGKPAFFRCPKCKKIIKVDKDIKATIVKQNA